MKTTSSSLILLTSLFFISACTEPKQSTQNLISNKLSIATFAGGCFWCVESDFEKVAGVQQVISGFSGGNIANPSYQQVSSGKTEHVEAVQVYYDPKIISYSNLLQVFWQQINPTDNKGQFVDRGKHYRPIIFYHNHQQYQLAETSKQNLQLSGVSAHLSPQKSLPIKTFILQKNIIRITIKKIQFVINITAINQVEINTSLQYGKIT